MSALEPTIKALRDLVWDVLDAKVGLPVVEKRLKNVLDLEIESKPVLREILGSFVNELVTRYVLEDKLPLRVESLARIAWRTQLAADPGLSTTVGLMVIDKLSHLDDEAAALALAELVQADAHERLDRQLRAALALRMRCLMHLDRFGEVHQSTKEYEGEPSLRAEDALEVVVLLFGASAASLLNEHDDAIRRATLVVERYAQGSANSWNDNVVKFVFGATRAAKVYCAWGDALRRSNDHLGAIDAYKQGRERAFEESDRAGAAFCLSEIGITWEHLADFGRGAGYLEQAAREADQIDDTQSAARWRKQPVRQGDGPIDLRGVNGLAAIGQALSTKGPSDEIEAAIKSIVKEERGKGNSIEPMARNLLAALYSAQKRHALALVAIDAAVASADKLQEKWIAMAFRSNQVRILFRSLDWTAAHRVCERIFSDGEEFLAEARTSEIRQAAMSAVAAAAEVALVMASTDAERSDGTAVARDADRVLGIVDRTRGRTFNRWLALMDWSRNSGSVDIVKTARALIAADVVVESTAYEGRMMKPALESRSSADAAWARTVAAQGVTRPDFDRRAPMPSFASVLPPSTTLLDLSATESGIVCLCFEAGAAPRTLHIPWQRSDRTSWHARWQSAWNGEAERLAKFGSDSNTTPGTVERGESPTAEPTSMVYVYAALRRKLVEPLMEWLGANLKHLIVSMHAELAFVPIWSLAQGAPGLSLSVVPTLRSIPLLADRPAPAGTENIVSGDATRTLAMAHTECALLRGYTNIEPTVEDMRQSMPFARRMHFAGHGEFNRDNPYTSGIILQGTSESPYAIATTYKNCVRFSIAGILRYLDMTNCELVTISACSVGTPRAHAASEFTSVPTAFLLAGARNVLAASWHIHDAGTTVLMAHFYRSLESTPCVSAALASARRSLQDTSREEAHEILGRGDVIPPGDLPFSSPIFTDAVIHYGIQ